MSIDPAQGPETGDRDDTYARLVARYSAPETVAAALERVKSQVWRRQAARDLITRAGDGLLHNHTVREIARYFRTADRGRVEPLHVAESTGISLNDSIQVLREFADAGLLNQYEEPAEHQDVRRTFELADGAKGGMTDVFIETEAADQREEQTRQASVRAPGNLGWKW
ncbi:hypothetical protein ACH4Y0_38075 [Streptomyces sp. NPDC020707]|uniref:hypothetical protein n=1 Tax=Streptomyces sp. NPDC020707 TaxID=3365084 RepID=UPI0037BC723D